MNPPLPKRQRRQLKPLPLHEDVSRALDDAIKSSSSAEAAILHLLASFSIDFSLLRSVIADRGLNVSFSRVQYSAIAPLVGLDPLARLRDVHHFEVYRARIPTDLFTEIVDDVQIAINNYGLPEDHQNEEARSRLIATLFTRLTAEFKLLVVNTPESIIEGRITTKGRIEYLFKAFGGVAMLFIEVKYRLSTGDEYLDAVGQVIAEADACDYINARNNLRCPVYGILCDGTTFQFFRYDQNRTPYIARGVFPFSKAGSTHGQSLKLADLQSDSHLDFWRTARIIAEAIFYILLLSYERALQAYYNRSMETAQADGKTRASTPEWFKSLGFASRALGQAVEAGKVHAAGMVDQAELQAVEALAILQDSVRTAPKTFRREDAQLKSGIDRAALLAF